MQPLIGVPTDIGAGPARASMGPEALRVAGLIEMLKNHGLGVVDSGNLAGPTNLGYPQSMVIATLRKSHNGMKPCMRRVTPLCKKAICRLF